MSPRSPEVPIDDDNRHQDGDGVHDECEEQVFGNERQDYRRRRQDFWDKQEEHNEWEENADAQRHFLSGFGWQVEDQHAEEWDQDGGQDQVDRVEQSLAPDRYEKSDVRLGGLWFVVDVEISWHLDDVPRSRFPIVWEIYIIFLVVQQQTDL